MLAAFHRNLVTAPFNTFRHRGHSMHSVEVQKNLRENAAGIAATSGFPLQQRIHLDDHGLALVWTAADTQAARQGGVKVVFTGTLTNYDDICSLYGCDSFAHTQDAATLVLQLYMQEYKDSYGDSSDQPSCLLQCMEVAEDRWIACVCNTHATGDFAFILFDSHLRYTLVARKGRAPLFWGSDNGDGDSLLISTVPAYLSPFPPGCAFESQVNEEGEGDSRMFNFCRFSPSQRGVDTVKRIDSKGHLCGLLFKSVSGQDLVQGMSTVPPNVY